MPETQVRSLGGDDSLEKEMTTCSSILAWKIPWTEEPGRLQSRSLLRVGHDWSNWTRVHPDFWWREKGERLSSTTSGQWFNQSCLCHEASLETQQGMVLRASGLVNSWRFGEPFARGQGAPGEGMGALHPLPPPWSSSLLHLAVPELYPSIISP